MVSADPLQGLLVNRLMSDFPDVEVIARLGRVHGVLGVSRLYDRNFDKTPNRLTRADGIIATAASRPAGLEP